MDSKQLDSMYKYHMTYQSDMAPANVAEIYAELLRLREENARMAATTKRHIENCTFEGVTYHILMDILLPQPPEGGER